MSEPDTYARRIRDAFERDLDAYQAPSDLAARARRGGRRRTWWRRIFMFAGLAALAGAAAIVGSTMSPGGGSSTGPKLTAWTVTRKPDHTVQVMIRELFQPRELAATLRGNGVPAAVYVNDGPVCHESLAPGSPLRVAVTVVQPVAGSGTFTYEFHTAAIPDGDRVAFEFSDSGATRVVLRIVLLTASGQCTP
jgi:hypothetical protein